jgi:hypothetical protein
MQEFHADQLSDPPSDCESDKSSVMVMMMTTILDPQSHRKTEKCRG